MVVEWRFHSRQAGTPRGRPSRGTAGTNPKTAGHQPKDWQALPFNTVGVREFFLDFGECVSEVVRGSSILAWGLGLTVLSAVGWSFPSTSSSLVALVLSPQGGGWQPQLPCVLPVSDGFLSRCPSYGSTFVYFLQFWWNSATPKLLPSVSRDVHARLSALSLPSERTGDNAQSHMNGKD